LGQTVSAIIQKPTVAPSQPKRALSKKRTRENGFWFRVELDKSSSSSTIRLRRKNETMNKILLLHISKMDALHEAQLSYSRSFSSRLVSMV